MPDRMANSPWGNRLAQQLAQEVGLDPQQFQPGILKRATTINATRMVTPIFHPAFEISTMRLPQSLEQRNIWRRHYYRYDPYVSRAVDLHTQFPLSQFQIQCDDPAVRRDYEEIADDLDLFQLFLWISQEYWIVGEAIPYGVWDEENYTWSHFLLMNPDYIDIQWNPLFKDDKTYQIVKWADSLKKVVQNGARDPKTGPIYQRMAESNPDLVNCIKNNTPYNLNSHVTSHYARRANYFDIRGSGVIDACFKTLIYRDKLMEAQGAIADRHINVKEFYMLGETSEPATQDEFDQFDMLLRQSWTSPNQAIIWNHALRVQMEGASGKLLPLSPEFQHILEELSAGLKVPVAFLAGQGVPYANASVALDVMISEYLPHRQGLEKWAQKNVFEPVARARGYHRPEKKELVGHFRTHGKEQSRELIRPKIVWVKSVLRDNYQRLQTMITLAQTDQLPWDLVYQELNFYPDEIQEMMEKQREKQKEQQEQLNLEGIQPPAGMIGGAPPLDLGGSVPVGEMRTPFMPPESMEGLAEGVSPMEPTPAEEPALELA